LLGPSTACRLAASTCIRICARDTDPAESLCALERQTGRKAHAGTRACMCFRLRTRLGQRVGEGSRPTSMHFVHCTRDARRREGKVETDSVG
jgi:hypothetical protein